MLKKIDMFRFSPKLVNFMFRFSPELAQFIFRFSPKMLTNPDKYSKIILGDSL